MHSLITCILILRARTLAQAVNDGSPANPVKTLDFGTFKGFHDPQTNADNWLGMPFAIYGRLQNPTVITSANKLQGVQDATKYGPPCPQTELIAPTLPGDNAQMRQVLAFFEQIVVQSISNQSENCLSINVQVPHGLDSTAGLPVLLWIHGGGFEIGSSASPSPELAPVRGLEFNGANIVQRSIQMGQPIVFVGANYRLNAFGELASQEIIDAGLGNLGLKDQRVAMQWVQKYIKEFGGDPTKVTLIGHSAGSISIATHMTLDNGDPKRLFRAAIMMSGGPSRWEDYQRGQPTFDAVMRSIGCDKAADKITCFRAAPYEAIYLAVQEQPSLLSYTGMSIPWFPRPDGQFMPEAPDVLLAQGKVANIPYIIGDMVDEGTLFSLVNQMNITTDAQFKEYFHTVYFRNGSRRVVDALCDMYSEDPADGSPFDTGQLNQLGPQYKRLAALTGDYAFHAPRRDLLARTSDRQNAWSYQTQVSLLPLGLWLSDPVLTGLPILGSVHATDANRYLFGTLPPEFSRNTRNIMSTFISFCNHLDPNLHGLPDLPLWPRYNSESKILFRFKEDGPDLMPDTFRSKPINFINSHPSIFRF